MNIPIDDQYYVGDMPYLLGVIKNGQFNYTYYLLALNRDSLKLYFVDNQQVTPVELPEGAPVDVPTALGEELTGGSLNYRTLGSLSGSNKEGVAYHGVSAKDEEVAIDWKTIIKQWISSYVRTLTIQKTTPCTCLLCQKIRQCSKNMPKYHSSVVRLPSVLLRPL